jgi:predicted AlkP superfamily phosphohydrolase/phosphomutase/tetratricopeptide (TPR) repeat protein
VLKKKLLLVGWDAADWQIINPLLKQGKLPALARLIANGARGNIATLDPPISPMLWTSIATGKRPFKHGILGFTEAMPGGKKARPVRVTSRKCHAIWNLLNDRGLKTNVIGWWPSHPAEPVNGIAVSNFYGVIAEESERMQPMIPDTVHPKSLEEVFADLRVHPGELTPEIVQPFFPDADGLRSEDDEVLRSTMKIVAHAASIHAAATYALAESEWDFTAVYYDALDHFSHVGMKFHPPRLSRVSERDFKKYHYIVEGAYRFHDMMLERLLDLAGDDCNVMLVSDHGFINDQKRLIQLPDEPGAPALEHRPYGVLLASGPDFKQGPVYGASLLDVAPTILKLYGLPAARDFDGRALDIVRGEPAVSSWIDSYETAEKPKSETGARMEGIDEDILKQLQALGYIDDVSTASGARTVLIENEYYLARSYADAGLYDQAMAVIKPIAAAYPDIARYNRFYASLLLRTGNIEWLEKHLEKQSRSPFNHYLKGLVWLQKQRPLLALQEFDQIEATANPAVVCQIAVALMQSGQLNQAAHTIQEVLRFETENHHAQNIAGEIALQQEDWEGALAHFLKSTGLLFYQPGIHEKVGICLERLEHYPDAAQALELALQFNPQKESIKHMLLELYTTHVRNPMRLSELQRETTNQETVVVTGFPRSGTSMMMQILKSGGLAVLADDSRREDEHNPKGYFELEAVKRLAVDDCFMADARGKAIKIVMPLIRLLKPTYPLKVIWMDRPLEAVVRSQQKMAGRQSALLDLQLLMKMRHEQELMKQWLESNAAVSFIQVDYDAAIENPKVVLKKLTSFLGKQFVLNYALDIIDPGLKNF